MSRTFLQIAEDIIAATNVDANMFVSRNSHNASQTFLQRALSTIRHDSSRIENIDQVVCAGIMINTGVAGREPV